MNIIILTDRYHPNPVSSAILAYDLAIELNQQGHNVFVLTADSKLDCEYTISKEEGINIIRVRAQNQKKLSKQVNSTVNINIEAECRVYYHNLYKK